jgi:DNA-binding NarL/FixJ family response regulator
MLSGSIDRGLVADVIAQRAQGFVGREKPVGAIVEALEMAHQGHLAVDPLLLHEILRPHDAADRRDVGRTTRRDTGRPDRRRPGVVHTHNDPSG